MELENQVCSLELSRKLLSLGVEQDSLFYYLNIDGEGKYYIYYKDYLPEEFEYEGDPISAFTVAELGEMLPKYTPNSDKPFSQQYRLEDGKYLVGHVSEHTRPMVFSFTDENEANARAQMIICLLENGLLDAN